MTTNHPFLVRYARVSTVSFGASDLYPLPHPIRRDGLGIQVVVVHEGGAFSRAPEVGRLLSDGLARGRWSSRLQELHLDAEPLAFTREEEGHRCLVPGDALYFDELAYEN